MKSNKLRIVEIIALLISSIVTIWTILRATEWHLDFTALAFICWAVSPYAILLAVDVLLAKFNALPKTSLVTCITAVLMLAFTILFYLGTLNGDTSSTYALIFLFVPAALYIGGFVLLAVGLFTAWLLARFAKRNNSD